MIRLAWPGIAESAEEMAKFNWAFVCEMGAFERV